MFKTRLGHTLPFSAVFPGPVLVFDESRRSAFEKNPGLPYFGCCGTYGSISSVDNPTCALAGPMEFGFPLCGGGAPFVCVDPACCGLCDENLELMLDIQELRLRCVLLPGSGET